MRVIRTENSNCVYKGNGDNVLDIPCERVEHGCVRYVVELTDQERIAVSMGRNLRITILQEPIPPTMVEVVDEKEMTHDIKTD